jgi:hypothetical protein
VRLKLGSGVYNGKRLIAAAALDQPHRPQAPLGVHPATRAPTFYGLGWNVVRDRQGVQLECERRLVPRQVNKQRGCVG